MSTKRVKSGNKPLIGLTIDHDPGKFFRPRAKYEGTYYLSECYASAIEQAGGIPVLLPYLTDYSNTRYLMNTEINGLLITGGGFDVHPSFYGEKPLKKLGHLKPERTEFEMKILRMALKLKMPVLGICGGMQLMNVAFGGSLYQDIPMQIPDVLEHLQRIPSNRLFHHINIEQGSQLHKIFGTTRMKVNSTHHQSVKTPGKSMVISARAPDGVVEAVEMEKGHFCIGVQWHPEVQKITKGRILEPTQKKLFTAFIDASETFNRGRK